MPTSDEPSMQELLAALADTPLGAELKDPELYRQRVYRQMAEDDDPLLREIGQQLRDGTLRPHQLLTIPGYEEVVARGLEQRRQLNRDDVRDAIVNCLDSVSKEPEAGR